MKRIWIHVIFSAIVLSVVPVFHAMAEEKTGRLGPEDLVQAVLAGNHRLRAQRLDAAAAVRRSDGGARGRTPC